MKKKIIILIITIFFLLFVWIVSKIQIVSGVSYVSENIMVSKNDKVFVKQFDIKDSTFLFKNGIQIKIKEAWIEKVHYTGFWRNSWEIDKEWYSIVLLMETPQLNEYGDSWIIKAFYENDSTYVGRNISTFRFGHKKIGDTLVLKALEHRTPENLKRELGSIVLTSSK